MWFDVLHITLAVSLVVLSLLIVRIAYDDDFRVRSFYNEEGRRQNFLMSAFTYLLEGLHQLAVSFNAYYWLHAIVVICTILAAATASVQILWRAYLAAQSDKILSGLENRRHE